MSDTEEKKHPASERKLKKQREQGSVASSQDLSGLMAAAGGIVCLVAIGASLWTWLVRYLLFNTEVIQLPHEQAINVIIGSMIDTLARATVPVVGSVLAISTIVSLIYNKGFLFAMKAVTPKLERVSPSSGIKRIYGRRGWIETLTQAVRLTLWLMLSALVGLVWLPTLIRSANCDLICLGAQLIPLVGLLVLGAAAMLMFFSGIDMPIQHALFLKEQRMTETELSREHKDSFGSKEVRQERNRIKNELSQRAPTPQLEDTTTLFFTTDRAVAICYAPPKYDLPTVVAKAAHPEEVAFLRSQLRSAGVPEWESLTVVDGAIYKDIGGTLDQSAFNEFARSLS